MPTRLRGDNFDWNDENVAELKRLYTVEGMTGDDIKKLWKDKTNAPTRNAIMGKLKRLGLVGDPSKPAKPNNPKPRQYRHHNKSDGLSAKTKRTPGGNTSFSFKRLGAVTAPPPAIQRAARAARVDLAPVTLEHGGPAKVKDLNDSMCHFPIGDPRHSNFAYCGRGAYGNSPYCADHRKVVYVPPPLKRKAAA